MNNSDNNSAKVIIGVIVAILILIIIIFVYNMFKNDNMTNDVNQTGQDITNGTENIVNGTEQATDNITNDVANGISDVANSIIDFTMTDNATVENNIKTNTSEKIKEDKKYDTLTFKEVTLIGRDNVTTFTAKIKNDSNDKFTSKDVTITFFKNDNTTITTRSLNIPDIEAGQTTEVTVNMEEDVANAYDYTIE